MDVTAADYVLTTTRSVRKRLDFTRPVPPEVIEECIEIATQAPSGSNAQGWAFVVVTDAEKKTAIADLYRRNFEAYRQQQPREYPADDPRAASQPRVRESAEYLAEHMHECPALVLVCGAGRVENFGVGAQAGFYGSIIPAAWSFMLAARARGIGMAWTTIHLASEKETAELLGIPDYVTQTVLFPLAYFTGDGFKPATRLPARRVTHWNSWGNHREG